MNQRLTCLMQLILLAFVATSVAAQGHGPMFEISIGTHMEGWPQACYNSNADEYLVVWEDYRNGDSDIYGQVVKGDGTLDGADFAICASEGHQFWPRLDFDPERGQFLIVFEDWRGASGDIRGILMTGDGVFVDAPTSDADHSFGICTNDANVYTCSVAYNLDAQRYLAVWGDYRNDPTGASFTGADVFGQIVNHDGTLLAPPAPADPDSNFAVAVDPDVYESVADVTFCMGTLEWFAVYGTSTGYVYGQRLNGLGEIIDPAGDVVSGPDLSTSAIAASEQFDNGPDGLQARVKANSELYGTVDGWVECEVVWMGKGSGLDDNDIWGQRIGFFSEGGSWAAEYLDVNGDITPVVSNHAISVQDGWCGVPEVDFSVADNEFLVSWGDPRNYSTTGEDLYYQRLWVDVDQTYDMFWLDDDRVGTVTETENIPVFTTEHYEGSLLGIAHSIERNEFLVAFTYEDTSLTRETDIMGVIASGSPPTGVEDSAPVSVGIQVDAGFPNPFSRETSIRFGLPADGRATVLAYDVGGRQVATLSDGVREAGQHTIVWNGQDDQGDDLGAGVYHLEVRYGSLASTRKIVLLR